MQNRFGRLDTDVMPIFMITALDIVITSRFSINCSAVICSPTVLFHILREATSETYGPRVYFPSYKFPIYFYFEIFTFNLYHKNTKKYDHLYQISLLQVVMKGLTTRLSRWLQGSYFLVWVRGTCVWPPTGLMPWFSKTEGNTYATLLHHPFLFKGKTNACLGGSREEEA